MKNRYRLFLRRQSVYYAFDNTTKTFQSLKTKDKAVAERLLLALNEAGKQPAMNLGLARVYLKHSDPMVSERTWQHVFDEIIKLKSGPTQSRWQSAAKDKAFDLIRNRLLIETQAEHFLAVLKKGTVSTNAYLRKTHNFALDMNWLPATVIPRRQWPPIRYEEKRAIKFEEHQRILAGERNSEWLAYYHALWEIGGAQTDVARLRAEDIDWEGKVLAYRRRKTGTPVLLHFGPQLANLLSDLPGEGLLFPRIAAMSESDRGSLFRRRCRLVGISGVSLHSYRYAWVLPSLVRVRRLRNMPGVYPAPGCVRQGGRSAHGHFAESASCH